MNLSRQAASFGVMVGALFGCGGPAAQTPAAPVRAVVSPTPSPPPRVEPKAAKTGADVRWEPHGRCRLAVVEAGTTRALFVASDRDQYLLMVPVHPRIQVGCDGASLDEHPGLVLYMRYPSLDIDVRMYSTRLDFVASETATLAKILNATEKAFPPGSLSNLDRTVSGKPGALLATLTGNLASKTARGPFTLFLTLRQRPRDKQLYKVLVTMGDVTRETREEWRAFLSEPQNPILDDPGNAPMPGTTLARGEPSPRAPIALAAPAD